MATVERSRGMTKQQKEWMRVCESTADAPVISSAAEAAATVRYHIEQLNGYEFEHLVAVFLNTHHKVVGSCVAGIGGFAGAEVVPAIIFKKFFKTAGATTIIIGHNHPSGSTTASASDKFFSLKIRSIAKDLGVELLDSLIVTHDSYAPILSEPYQ